MRSKGKVTVIGPLTGGPLIDIDIPQADTHARPSWAPRPPIEPLVDVPCLVVWGQVGEIFYLQLYISSESRYCRCNSHVVVDAACRTERLAAPYGLPAASPNGSPSCGPAHFVAIRKGIFTCSLPQFSHDASLLVLELAVPHVARPHRLDMVHAGRQLGRHDLGCCATAACPRRGRTSRPLRMWGSPATYPTA